MIVLEPPLVRQFFDEHQVLEREIMCVVYHEELCPILVKVSHEMRFVIDHMAKPPIVSGAIDEWAAGLKPLAAFPNVFVKLSGMVTEADWKRWTVRDITPYVTRVLEWFGPERCVFGSDWPVCLVAASYAHVIDACGQAIGDIPIADRERIFGGNAVELYRLPVPATVERRS